MFGVEQFILQRIPNPLYSTTKWAASVSDTINVLLTSQHPELILCHTLIINTPSATVIKLTDTFGVTIFGEFLTGANQMLTGIPINHILESTLLKFTLIGGTGFSIGYQMIWHNYKK
jgi:hypothetical protein